MSYKLNTCNKSILVNELSFNALGSVVEDVNNDFNFDKCIANWELVNHKSSSNTKNTDQSNNIEESTINYHADEYVIWRIPEQVQQ